MMGVRWSKTQEIYETIEAGLDLVESCISNSEWDTRSWLNYSFKNEVVSIPSSLNSSWVVLNVKSEPSMHSSTPPASPERSLSCNMEHDSYDDELATTCSPPHRVLTSRPENTILSSQVTSSPKQEGSLTLTELGIAMGECRNGEVFLDMDSLARTPIHCTRPFRTNRSWTFSGSELPSPRYSIYSGSTMSLGHPTTPHTAGDGSLTSSLLASCLSSEKGLFISELFHTHQAALVEQIVPSEVATSLYNLALLEKAELSKLNTLNEEDKALAIVLHLQKILLSKPELFSDVYAALKKVGVRAIQDIKAAVRQRYPEDSDLLKSVCGLSRVELATPSDFQPLSSISSHGSEVFEDTVTALEDASKNGLLITAQEIISKEVFKDNGSSLLFELCRLDVSVCALNVLLTHATIDLLSTTMRNRTALHVTTAALCHNSSNLQVQQNLLKQQRMKIENLLKHGACPNTQDDDGNTVLHLAALRKDTETVAIVLRQATADLNLLNNCGNTALHIACREGIVELVQLLCSHGAFVTTPNTTKERKTPLHYACSWGIVDMVTSLLNNDSSQKFIDAQDGAMETALHIASRCGHKTVIKLLISKRANKRIKNKDGQTPIDLAVLYEHKKAAKALEKRSPWLRRRRTRSTGLNSTLCVAPQPATSHNGDQDETIP